MTPKQPPNRPNQNDHLASQNINQTFSELFDPRPEQWGLRGDPLLWDELCVFLSSQKMPNSANAVGTMIARAITTLTEAPFDGTDEFRVERYPTQGM